MGQQVKEWTREKEWRRTRTHHERDEGPHRSSPPVAEVSVLDLDVHRHGSTGKGPDEDREASERVDGKKVKGRRTNRKSVLAAMADAE